jgi:HK97 family phage major capsid protein
MLYLVEQTPVMRAGALVITTSTGEEMLVPKATAYQSSAITAEGQPISESDPTLAVTSLKAYGYKSFWQVSRELIEDSPANLLDALAQGAATSLALAYGADLATGNGTGKPLGYTNATVGKQGPTGTATSLGAQTTVGQGTDLLFDLFGSVAEPYLLSPAVGAVASNASFTIAKKLRDGQNRPVLDMTPTVPGASVNLAGYPGYVDPHAPAMAANAKSIAFGDWSRFVVRIVKGVRLERSDDFAFSSDLVSFKAVIRLDGAIVDTTALKLFQNGAS